MKKVTFIALAFAAVAVSFSSCKTEDTTNPVLTLVAPTSDTVEVEAGTKVIIQVNVTDDTELKSVEAFNGDATVSASKVTEFTDSKALIYKTPEITIDKATTIKVVAIDAADNQDAISVVYKIKAVVVAKALTAIPVDKSLGAGGNQTLGSYLDIDGGNVYSYTQTNGKPAVVALIDAIFNETSLFDVASPAIASATGTKFATTTLDATKFAASTEDDIKGLTASLSTVAVSQGAVIYFKTKAGLEGLILIKSFTASTDPKNGGNASMTIEIRAKK